MIQTMRSIVLLAAVSLTVPYCVANEPDVRVSVMTKSFHMNRSKDYNEENFGLGLEVASGDYRAGASSYKNSFYRQSNTLYASWLPVSVNSAKLGIQAGFVSGYPVYDYKYGPYVTGLAEIPLSSAVRLNILLIPPTKSGASGALAAQLTFSLLRGAL